MCALTGCWCGELNDPTQPSPDFCGASPAPDTPVHDTDVNTRMKERYSCMLQPNLNTFIITYIQNTLSKNVSSLIMFKIMSYVVLSV